MKTPVMALLIAASLFSANALATTTFSCPASVNSHPVTNGHHEFNNEWVAQLNNGPLLHGYTNSSTPSAFQGILVSKTNQVFCSYYNGKKNKGDIISSSIPVAPPSKKCELKGGLIIKPSSIDWHPTADSGDVSFGNVTGCASPTCHVVCK